MLHVAGKYNTFNCRSFAAAVARLLHSVPPRDRLCQPGVISRGTRENAVPIVIVFNHALLTALRTIFRPKTLYIAGFCTYNLNFFFWGGIILPGPYRSAPGAWTQTPISAWLASVPIVPVLRNDHWDIDLFVSNVLLLLSMQQQCGKCGTVGVLLCTNAFMFVSMVYSRNTGWPKNWHIFVRLTSYWPIQTHFAVWIRRTL